MLCIRPRYASDTDIESMETLPDETAKTVRDKKLPASMQAAVEALQKAEEEHHPTQNGHQEPEKRPMTGRELALKAKEHRNVARAVFYAP